MNDIQNRLLNVIYSTLKIDHINREDLLEGNLVEKLGISSIDSLEILIGIEREFDIVIDDENLSQDLLASLSNLESYVTSKLGTETAI